MSKISNLSKSLHKLIEKNLYQKKKNKEKAQKIVNDILDPDNVAEENDEEPPKKVSVLYKNEGNGIAKLKYFLNKVKNK